MLLFVGIIFTGCSDSVTDSSNPPNSQKYSQSDDLARIVGENLTSANLRFALRSFQTLVDLEPSDSNIFFSPLSLSIALAMTYNGAQGETHVAMRNTLEFQDMDLEEVNRQFSYLIQSLENCDDHSILELANSIWIHSAFPVKPDFIQRNQDHYFSEVANLDFGDPETIDIINGWIEEHTNGRITEMITYIDPLEVMFLINALYFLADWTYQFDADSTKADRFNLLDGTDKEVAMMKNSGSKYTFYEDYDFAAVRMPYGRDVLAMYVFLPRTDYHIDEFINALDAADYDTWINAFQRNNTTILKLPQFRMDYGKELKDVLSALGMGIAFDVNANFHDINNGPLWISRVIQKTFIYVHEEGTEAAAATAVALMCGLEPTPPTSFIVNRPFFFVIQDDRTGTILFMGKIVDPIYE